MAKKKTRPPQTPSIKIDTSRCWVECAAVGFGFWLYLCWAREVAGPVGLVWGIPSSLRDGRGHFDVIGSYVPPAYRRKGIRTLINNEILKECEVIVSRDGSEEGGAVFMEAFGYSRLADGTWSYMKKR